MFRHLSGISKATLFCGFSLGLILLLALLGQGLGEAILAIAMFTPLAAVLLMQFVVTHDGTTRTGWRILGLLYLGLRTWGLASGVITLMALVAVWLIYRLQRQPNPEQTALSTLEVQL